LLVFFFFFFFFFCSANFVEFIANKDI